MASIANMLKTVMQETNTSVPIQASTQVATPPSPKKPSPEPSPTDAKIKNKGTGAGGANTNKNGLSYESLTDLDDKLEIIESGQYSCKIKFNVSDIVLTRTKQSHLFKCMKDHINKQVKKAHGCKIQTSATSTKQVKPCSSSRKNSNKHQVQYVKKSKHRISRFGNTVAPFPNMILCMYIVSQIGSKTTVKLNSSTLSLKKNPNLLGRKRDIQD